MSDDEYYGNSPLDEYDEYWDEGAVDVAGDLAEHTIYSPVWQDDPDYGLNYTYSDWECESSRSLETFTTLRGVLLWFPPCFLNWALPSINNIAWGLGLFPSNHSTERWTHIFY